MEIGARVRDGEGFRGTVKYVGPVVIAKNKEDIWLGVDWDKANRGKPKSGIFLLISEGNSVNYKLLVVAQQM